MAQVNFSSSLDMADKSTVSPKVIDVIGIAAEKSGNPVITITSTIRPPIRQARVMYDNLIAGNRIAYAAPGREVVSVFDKLKAKGCAQTQILDAMEKKIIELSLGGLRVSKHCVSESEYSKMNIIDVSTRIPNPRDFVKQLIHFANVAKVITPFSSDYGDPIVSIDANEPAIHLEIAV
jgi:hypothetical protein